MGRSPVISRRAILTAALDLIDREGVEAVTTRRLGNELGVNGASLYYHFESMDEILAGVCALVLERNTPPDDAAAVSHAASHWQDAMLAAIRTYRACIVEHPDVAWLMLRPDARRYSAKAWALGAEVLLEAGIPKRYVLLILEHLEVLAISSVLLSTSGSTSEAFAPTLSRQRGEPYSSLRVALRAAKDVGSDEWFEVACRAFLDGIAKLAAGDDAADAPDRRDTKTTWQRRGRRGAATS